MKSRLIVACVATFLLGIAALKGAGGSDVADAVMKGNKTALRALLQQKADVNALASTVRRHCSGRSIAMTSRRSTC